MIQPDTALTRCGLGPLYQTDSQNIFVVLTRLQGGFWVWLPKGLCQKLTATHWSRASETAFSNGNGIFPWAAENKQW